MTDPDDRSLAGMRVAVTRSRDRAGALADALAAAGARPVLVPLIDFEAVDTETLAAPLDRLAAGEYRWLVISSITTVRALKQWAQRKGTRLADLVPAGTQVATIGPTSTAILTAEGLRVDLAPTDLQSAAGLVALWPDAAGESAPRVLLPQSNLAEPTLVDGLTAKGWGVEVVRAYRTVDYPAEGRNRLTAVLAAAERPTAAETAYPELAVAAAAAEVAAGRIGAVVVASGSAARRVAATMAPLPPQCLLVAIGRPTRAECERLGLAVAATAATPTPQGIVAALLDASNPPFPEQEHL